jgi:iron complex outermembrane recepter protein
MEHREFQCRSASIAAAVSLVLCSVQAGAQDRSLEEIVVTGSHIRGTPEDTAIPVEVITLEDMENLGRPSNIDIVKLMSEVGQVAGEADRANLFPIGAASVNLRNLGSRFTTVIFNGRRFAEQNAGAPGRFNNINWIPNAAVGRIEILKEGGAATYGADAIGGVVNYLTRRDFNGLEMSADYRYIEDSNGDYNADMLWGTTFDRGNVLVSLGYQHRSDLDALDRDWAHRALLENFAAYSANGSPGAYIFQTRTTAAGAPSPNTFTAITPSAAVGTVNRYVGNQQMSNTGIVRDPNCTALGGFAGWSATPSPVCYFEQLQFQKLVEESSTYSLFSEVNYKLTDDLQFHAEGLYLQQHLPNISKDPSDAPGVWPLLEGSPTGARQVVGASPAYFVDGNNPGLINLLNNIRNADGSLAFTPAQIAEITSTGRAALPQGTWRPFGNGGNPLSGPYDIQENKVNTWRTTAALSGYLPKFWGTNLEWEVALTYSHVKSEIHTRDMLADRLQAALNGLGGANCNGIEAGQAGSSCQWFNPFSSAIARNIYTGHTNPGYVPGLANSADLARWLYVPIWQESIYENVFFDPVIRGETGLNLPGGPVSMALGGQFRWGREEYRLDDLSNRDINPCATPGVTVCANRQGPLVFTRPTFIFGRSQEQERRYPVAAAFIEAQLPLLDTVNMQLAGRFEKFYSDLSDKDNEVFVPAGAIKWQPLPWMALRASAGKTFSQVNPPRDDGPTIGNSLPNANYGNVGSTQTNPSTSYVTANYDNLDVDPEHGTYLNLGWLVQAGGFSATFDYYDIRIENYARTLTTGNIITALVMPGQTPAIDNLINCSSPLVTTPRTGLGGNPFVTLNGPCVQGSSRLNSAVGGGGLGGGVMSYFGGAGQTNGGELKTTGIDVEMSYSFGNVFGGRLTPSVNFSYILGWEMGDFTIYGITVAEGYDARGFRNTSASRTGAQVVPDYRGTIGLNYNRGKHTLNIIARYIPGVVDENPQNFDASNDQNANVGDASGVTTGAACAGSSSGLTSNIGNVPAGAGTGQFGTGSVTGPGGTVPAGTVGFCGLQNTSLLSGQEIGSSTTVDMTYRVQLPREIDLSFTIYNLLDDDPSFAREAISYDAGFGTPLGRNYKMTFKKRF